jgi:hypothetical protein
MSLRPQDRERGLVALNEARQTRRRAIVFGRVRVREVATGFWLMTIAGLLIFSFAYYRYTLVQLEVRKGEVMGRQRAVAAAVGNRGFALRERLEGWVIALAAGSLPYGVAPGVQLEAIANGPAVYVRLPLEEAVSPERIRKAAARSLRDGFTSCLFIGATRDPLQGAACTSTSQCGPGEVCSDFSVCAAPAHPYNLRLLNEGLRVLDPEWKRTLDAATDDLEVRAIELDLEAVGKHEAVAAVELVKKSRYFTAVLDEAPTTGVVAPASGPGSSVEEQRQAVDHRVRVGVWDISTGSALAVLQLDAAGRFVRMGANAAPDAQTLLSQQRQANGCAAATQVREALTPAAVEVPQQAGAASGEPGGRVAGE